MQGNVSSGTRCSHFLLECGWVVQHKDGETDDDMLSRIYGTFVDNYIEKCEAKAELLDTGDSKIRESAMRAKVKAGFMRSNRTLPINHLIEKMRPSKPIASSTTSTGSMPNR